MKRPLTRGASGVKAEYRAMLVLQRARTHTFVPRDRGRIVREQARRYIRVLDDVAPTSTSFYDLRATCQTLRFTFTLYTYGVMPS